MSRKDAKGRAGVDHLLSSGLRAEILVRLWGGGSVADSLSPSEFAAEAGKPARCVAYHFGVLADFGAIELADTIAREGTIERRYRFDQSADPRLVEALEQRP